MKVIDSIWFSSRMGHCGFVIGEHETTGERKLCAGAVLGFDQSADEQEILDWGTKVNPDILGRFLERLNTSKRVK